MVTGYDLDARTVGELPEALVANVLANIEPFDVRAAAATGDAAAAALRERVPSEPRAQFDEALAEARVALDLRDDNGPMTVEWTVGLAGVPCSRPGGGSSSGAGSRMPSTPWS